MVRILKALAQILCSIHIILVVQTLIPNALWASYVYHWIGNSEFVLVKKSFVLEFSQTSKIPWSFGLEWLKGFFIVCCVFLTKIYSLVWNFDPLSRHRSMFLGASKRNSIFMDVRKSSLGKLILRRLHWSLSWKASVFQQHIFPRGFDWSAHWSF